MTNQPHKANEYSTPSVEGGGGIPGAALFFFAVMMVFVGGMAVYFATQMGNPPSSGSLAVEDPDSEVGGGAEWLHEFQLTERSGKEVGSEDLRGKVWVANFFFSTCPGTCRQQSTLVSSLERDYRQQEVKFVSISCDPRVDTPEVLRKYAVNFQAPDDWWFLTGDLTYIRRVGAEFFQLSVSEKGHQDRLGVVDKWGKVRGRFNWHDDVQMLKMKDLIAELLAETEPPAEPVDPQGPRKRVRDPYEEDEEDMDAEAPSEADVNQPVDEASDPGEAAEQGSGQ